LRAEGEAIQFSESRLDRHAPAGLAMTRKKSPRVSWHGRVRRCDSFVMSRSAATKQSRSGAPLGSSHLSGARDDERWEDGCHPMKNRPRRRGPETHPLGRAALEPGPDDARGAKPSAIGISMVNAARRTRAKSRCPYYVSSCLHKKM
jgi:hypothetical protein